MSSHRIARVELALRRIVPSPSWRRRVVLDRGNKHYNDVADTVTPVTGLPKHRILLTTNLQWAKVKNTAGKMKSDIDDSHKTR